MNDCIAVLPAGGSSQRCGTLKQFAPLHDKTVLWYALQPFLACRQIKQIRVVVAADKMQQAQPALAGCGEQVMILPVGGATRAESVYNGLSDCADETWVAVHDAARPCLSAPALQRLLAYCDTGGGDGAALALPVNEALKTVQENCIRTVVQREHIWAMQTPQLFRAGLLKRALQRYPQAADEAEAALNCGAQVEVVPGEQQNIKITHSEDITMAAALLRARHEEAAAQ